MNDSIDKSSIRMIRWVARILGSLVGFVGLWGTIEGLEYNLTHRAEATTSGYLIWAGFVLIFAGCVVGWFKELAASLLILGGTALLGAIALLAPSAFRGAYTLSVPALLGFLFLYVHLAGKKK